MKYLIKANKKDKLGTFTVSAYLGQELVGYADIIERSSHLEPYEMGDAALLVFPDHQRRGIATSMYDFAEKLTGKPMKPSLEQTEDGKKFWASRIQRDPLK